jgi:hypothetical protein
MAMYRRGRASLEPGPAGRKSTVDNASRSAGVRGARRGEASAMRVQTLRREGCGRRGTCLAATRADFTLTPILLRHLDRLRATKAIERAPAIASLRALCRSMSTAGSVSPGTYVAVCICHDSRGLFFVLCPLAARG